MERLDPGEIGVADIKLLLEPQVKVKSTPPEPPPVDKDPDPDPMSERNIAAEEAAERYVGHCGHPPTLLHHPPPT